MGKKNFEEWLSEFRSSIADYHYYIDFEKIYSFGAEVLSRIFSDINI